MPDHADSPPHWVVGGSQLIHIKEHWPQPAYDVATEWATGGSDAERLRALAEWYRGWASVASNDADRDARLALAEHIEANARALTERGALILVNGGFDLDQGTYGRPLSPCLGNGREP